MGYVANYRCIAKVLFKATLLLPQFFEFSVGTFRDERDASSTCRSTIWAHAHTVAHDVYPFSAQNLSVAYDKLYAAVSRDIRPGSGANVASVSVFIIRSHAEDRPLSMINTIQWMSKIFRVQTVSSNLATFNNNNNNTMADAMLPHPT